MAKLSDKDIKYIADLGKLNLTKDFDKLKKQMISIIEYFNNLSDFVDSKEESNDNKINLSNVLSKDTLDTNITLSQDDALSAVENSHNGYFVAKNVFEDNT